MGIPIGTKLGVYEVVAPLGAGGMGEVYKARDSRLERTVAIKVLSAGLSFGPDVKARFEREARAIAQLQHPHICTLYDVGRHEDTEFLVMEYLEGESLADRLQRGPLPLDQVARLGIDIAGALERAHNAGIVHRDLKPGNIMMTKSGAKLLDFGLAKPQSAQISGTAPLLSAAVTMSSPVPGASPLTTAGTVLGTIQYMSPEQIEGKEADARSDIFAFGAVLYQAATGKPAFEGKSQLSVATAILEKDPEPISILMPAAPAQLNQIIQTCLAKNPENRFQCAHDIAIALRWLDTKLPAASVRRPKWVLPVVWFALPALLLLAAIAGYFLHPSAPAPVVRSEISFPDDMKLGEAGNFALSPDGSKLALVAQFGTGKPVLSIRALNSLKPRPVDDSDEAQYPFWSPDSRYVGFFANGYLRKLDTASFSVSTICPAQDGRGGAWNSDDVIVFAPAPQGPLFRVSAGGGDPSAITKTATPDQTHRWPQFLPDGDHLIYMSGGAGEGSLMATSLSHPQPTVVTRSSGNALYAHGYLLYLRANTVVAQPFDVKELKLSGPPRNLVENVTTINARWIGAFSVSSTGELVFRSSSGAARVQLAWVDASANKIADVGEPGPYAGIDLSPDGKRVLLGIPDAQTQNNNYWMMDVQRGVVTRFTFDPQSNDVNEQWPSDSKSVFFSSNTGGHYAIYRKAADGTQPRQLLLSQPNSDLVITTVSPDGKFAGFVNNTSQTCWVLPLTGGQKPYPFLQGKEQITISNWTPDRRWVLFISNQSGRNELYVTNFSELHGRWQISSDGAFGSAIRSDGKKIAYINNEHKVVSVDFDGSGSEPRIGKPEFLFGGRTVDGFQFSPTPDWKRILAGIRLEHGSPRITLVSNWPADLGK